MQGLKPKPNYEGLINVAVSDKLCNIKFPNRDATFLRNGFVLSQLDGEGMRVMQLQEEQAMKESLKDHLLKQTSQETGVNISDLRTPSNAKKRNIIINNMLRNTGTGDNDNPQQLTTFFSSEQLTTLSENLNSNNFEHKTELLAKAVFEYDYQQAKHRSNSIAMMKEALLATTRWAFTSQFSTTSGGIQWQGYYYIPSDRGLSVGLSVGF